MKNYIEKLKFYVAALIIFTIPTLHINAFGIGDDSIKVPKINEMVNDLVGAWDYTVENAPPEYSQGVISISEENGSFGVQVQLSAGVLKGESVRVDGNEINFDLFIEGETVEVMLTVDGDTIVGQSTGSDGTEYPIEGTRIKPQ